MLCSEGICKTDFKNLKLKPIKTTQNNLLFDLTDHRNSSRFQISYLSTFYTRGKRKKGRLLSDW